MKSIPRISALVMTGIALALSNCATGDRSPSGFLTHFSQLDAGYGTSDSVSAYVKPGADFKKYDQVIIDPVTTVVAANGVSAQVKDQLAAYLSESLRAHAAGTLKVVTTAGPTTMRVRVAITDVITAEKAGKALTQVHTAPKATLTGTLGSAELAAFMTTASFEGEVVDATTGERLSALVDHRLGAKHEASPKTTWASIRKRTDDGAARLVKRVLAVRNSL